MGSNPSFTVHGYVVSGTFSTLSELVSSSTNGGRVLLHIPGTGPSLLFHQLSSDMYPGQVLLWVLDSVVTRLAWSFLLEMERYCTRELCSACIWWRHGRKCWIGAELVKECPWRRQRVRGDLQKMQT